MRFFSTAAPRRGYLILLCAFLLAAGPLRAQILYVDSARAVSGAGTAWTTAYKTLQEALTAATSNTAITQIQVAKGTYYPSATVSNCSNCSGSRDYAFTLPRNNLAISGGYPTGGGTRNITANRTVLSGDIGTLNDASDNVYHVVYSYGLNSTAVLNGFTITGGNANGSSTAAVFINNTPVYRSNGGGMELVASSPTIASCTFSANAGTCGGGMSTESSSAPTVTGCLFSGNSASGGGGMNNGNSSAPTVTACVFAGNTASSGGGIFSFGASTQLASCVFSGNAGSSYGGGLYASFGASVAVNSCTFWNNASYNGGGVGVVGAGVNASVDLKNCILWGNTATFGASVFAGSGGSTPVSYCLIQDGYGAGGPGNGSADPLFVNSADPDGADNVFGTADDGLKLQFGSPAIDAGTATGAPATDVTGAARPQGAGQDIGAYEGGACPSATVTTLYVDSSVTASGTGTTWSAAFKTLQEAFDRAAQCTAVTGIQVAKGTYYPSAYPTGCTTCSTPRDYSFTPPRANLAIYGGYPSGGGTRSVAANRTILSGDLGTLNSIADNAYHVVFVQGLGSTAVLDGFTVTGGNASGSGTATITGKTVANNQGGGMYNQSSSLTVNACTFSSNAAFDGAGVLNNLSPVTLTACVFSANSAASGGGGLCNINSSPDVTACVFSANSAYGGGGVYNVSGAAPDLTGCTFAANTASGNGGAMRNDGPNNPVVKSCLLWGNTAPVSPAIYNNGTTATVTYSLVQGGYSGSSTNLSVDPLFVNSASPAGADGVFGTADDGLRPAYCSPAINAGTNLGSGSTDVAGATRIQSSTADMGAYERAPAGSPATRAALLPTVSTATLLRTCEESGWAYYALPGNADSVALAIAWGTSTAAQTAATVTVTTQASYTEAKNASGGTWASRRSWNVNLNGSTLAGTVGLRWYYAAADTAQVRSAVAASGFVPSAVKWVRTASSSTAYSSSLVQPSGSPLYVMVPTSSGSQNGVGYVQFDNVSSLGGGTALVNGGSSTVLPVTLLSFEARKDGADASALLDWGVADEAGTAYYAVERAPDGVAFAELGRVQAAQAARYAYADATPLAGLNYYRLRIVSRDGATAYSAVRPLDFGTVRTSARTVSVVPTPAHDRVHVVTDDPALQAGEGSITNAAGRWVATVVLTGGQAWVDVAGWQPGVYVLRFANGTVVKIEKN